MKQVRLTSRFDFFSAGPFFCIPIFLLSYTVLKTNCNTSKDFKAPWKPHKFMKKEVDLLHFSPDWKLQFNLNNNLIIPSFIAVSQLILDVLYSVSTKTVEQNFGTQLSLWGKHGRVGQQRVWEIPSFTLGNSFRWFVIGSVSYWGWC